MPGMTATPAPEFRRAPWPARLATLATLATLALLAACSTPGGGRGAGPQGPAVSPQDATVAPSASTLAAQATLTHMVGLQDRLYRVAAPLLIENADLCKNQARSLLGFTAKNKYSYPGIYADAAEAALGYGEQLQVTGVLAGSGAARVGLRRGDNLVSANGLTLPTGVNAETAAAGIFGPLVSSRATLAMAIERRGTIQTMTVPVTRACAFRVDLGNSDNINSYADGNRILITRGMINYAQSDDAIAYVMAKDMAHNILGHATLQRNVATEGSIIDSLASVRPDLSMLIGSGGIKPMPPELDAAADRLALYLLARAGYGIDGAARFWQRLASDYPASVLNDYVANHPGTPQRIAAINKAVAEIHGKQASRRPLIP